MKICDVSVLCVAAVCGLASLSVGSAALADAQKAAEPLTIQQAMALAEKNSPVLKFSEEAYLQAGGSLREARGGRLPSLGISGSYTRYDKVDQVSLGGGQSMKLGDIDSKTATATLSQPVDVSGVLGASVEAARLKRESARMDLEAARQQLQLSVRTAYLAVLQAREVEKVETESVDRLKEHLRLANVRLEAGSVPKFDVLRAETELANEEQALIAAQNSTRLAEVALANVMGVKLESSLNLQVPTIADRNLPPLEDELAQGQKLRPESQGAEYALEAAKHGIHIARRGLSPALQIAANYTWKGNTTTFSPRKFSADAMATVSIPIFDSGVTKGRVEQAEAGAASADAQKSQTALTVRMEVEQAYVSIENARKRLSAAETTVAQAAEALRLAQVRYENGAGMGVEVTDAQVALTQSQTNLVNARYDLFVSFAKLARAAGDPAIAMD